MENIHIWTDFKELLILKALPIQYEENDDNYVIWFSEGLITYKTSVYKRSGNVDCADFEDNYKDEANRPLSPKSIDGKEIVRAESRPIGTITTFTCIGDSETEIAKGKEFTWDFSNEDDTISMPSGSGMKRKRIEFKFIDSVWVKEGALYFFNTPKGCYLDFYVVCSENGYYIDNNGTVHQATEDTPIMHYGQHVFIQGDCPMGDEFNTETCSPEIKVPYKFWLEITTPDSDNISNGCVVLEMFRTRTVIL